MSAFLLSVKQVFELFCMNLTSYWNLTKEFFDLLVKSCPIVTPSNFVLSAASCSSIFVGIVHWLQYVAIPLDMVYPLSGNTRGSNFLFWILLGQRTPPNHPRINPRVPRTNQALCQSPFAQSLCIFVGIRKILNDSDKKDTKDVNNWFKCERITWHL